MDFWVQVWKRVWDMVFFGLKLGLDLEMQAAHPQQKFQGVPRLPSWGGRSVVAPAGREKEPIESSYVQ